ncbi:MAG: hypothetical protein E7G99_16105 [Enterococcus avium]|nr:hypothetical protein [Enterococcus avium]
MDVVKFLDDADIANDPNNPPQFTCEKCGKEMYPEYYRNALGIEFKISDMFNKKVNHTKSPPENSFSGGFLMSSR